MIGVRELAATNGRWSSSPLNPRMRTSRIRQFISWIRPQERFRRRKTLHPPSDGSDQVLQRTPESIVIVVARLGWKKWADDFLKDMGFNTLNGTRLESPIEESPLEEIRRQIEKAFRKLRQGIEASRYRSYRRSAWHVPDRLARSINDARTAKNLRLRRNLRSIRTAGAERSGKQPGDPKKAAAQFCRL